MSDVAEAIDNHLRVAGEIFDYQFFQYEPTQLHLRHYERNLESATHWMGAEIVQQVQELGLQAAEEFRAERETYRGVLERAGKKQFPQALKDRDPQATPLLVLPLHLPLHASEEKYDSTFVNPLVRALTGDRNVYIRDYERENRIAEKQAANINFLQIDDRFFEVVEERPYRKKLRIDTLSEDESIGLFGLNKAEHGNAEIALVFDWQASHSQAKLAEAVHARIGKCPHFVDEQEPYEPGVSHAWWRVYEFVPIPPQPKKPTIESYLTELATRETASEL